ncbi:MAG TPA: hypothetical protein VLL76_08655 [Candidatus Omnitrophota bacterium]|nr:hypothetical protein [Candidatus Omnitrophota bacterium]
MSKAIVIAAMTDGSRVAFGSNGRAVVERPLDGANPCAASDFAGCIVHLVEGQADAHAVAKSIGLRGLHQWTVEANHA